MQSLSIQELQGMFKKHLRKQGLAKTTIQTFSSDSFYLWNNASKEKFWEVVTSTDFDTIAKEEVYKALSTNSTGNADDLLSEYVYVLRRFKDFILNYDDDFYSVDDEEALKNFLLDIECLNPLSEWTSTFNMFDILKISRAEIRHSNILSWLLTPTENHGLNDSIIKGFIQYAITSSNMCQDIFGTLLMDYNDFIVLREWHNIDVLAVSEQEKFVLCIENKIDTGEHDNQLSRYKSIVDETYPDFEKLYIYLSPEGLESSDSDNWISMGYADVLHIIENARNSIKLLPDADLLINNYVDVIRRDIVGDERLRKICAEIYSKHKKALDLIFENKPDRASEVAEIIMSWAKEMMQNGKLELDEDKCVKTYTRFKTTFMSQLLPDTEEPLSYWKTKNYYFWEIKCDKGLEIKIQLAFASKNIPDELCEVCDEINKHFPSKKQNENWEFRIPFATKNSKIDEETSEEKIRELLNKKFEEVEKFEKSLKEKMGL